MPFHIVLEIGGFDTLAEWIAGSSPAMTSEKGSFFPKMLDVV